MCPISPLKGMVMGLLLGLVAALSLGTADFLARFAAAQVGAYRTLLYMQPPGLIGLSLYWIVAGLSLPPGGAASWAAWAWAVVVVVLNLLSTLALYRALQVGTVSIVSPIVASYAAITVLLSVLAGEQLSLSSGLGVGTLLIGVTLAAIPVASAVSQLPSDGQPRKLDRWSRGVGLALVAAVGYGIATWMLGAWVTPELGSIAPVWLIRLVTPCLLVAGAGPFRQTLKVPHRKVWWCIGGVGLLDTVGALAAVRGLATGQVALVSVLISLFSAVTVLLAGLFLRERLQGSQWLGVGLIFVGIVLVRS